MEAFSQVDICLFGDYNVPRFENAGVLRLII